MASDADDYVATAVQLGTDADYRASVAKRIRETSPVLFQDLAAVGEYERIFQELISR